MSLLFLKVACRAVAFKPEFLYTQKKPLLWPQGTALGFVTICDPAMFIMLLGKWKPTTAESTFNTKVLALENLRKVDYKFHLFTHITISVKSALFP